MSNQTKPEQRKWLSKKQLADHLGISVRNLSNWMNQHRVPFHRCGGRILFNLEKVEQALNSTEVKAR
jgi:excisionase family DNA binding protein